MNETQGFLTLGHSNWTICNLLNWFCSRIFPAFTQPPIINHFFLPQREEGMKMGKRNSPKVNEIQGFLTLGHSNWTICRLLSWFCSNFSPPFYPASLITIYYPRGGRVENGKRELFKSEWDTEVSDLGAFKLDHLQAVKLILFQIFSTFLPSLP